MGNRRGKWSERWSNILLFFHMALTKYKVQRRDKRERKRRGKRNEGKTGPSDASGEPPSCRCDGVRALAP